MYSSMSCRTAVVFLVSLAGISRAEDPPAPVQLEKIRQVYTAARQHFTNKDYLKSNEAYRELLTLLPSPQDGPHDPDRARVQYEVGANHVQLGQKKEAFESLNRAIDLGYANHQYLAADPTLAALRTEKEYEALLGRCKTALRSLIFGLRDTKGRLIEKKDYEGKVVIVDVWGTWCPPCRAEIPSFVRLQEKHRDKGLRIVGLTWEKTFQQQGLTDEATRKRVEQFADANKVNYPLVLMGQRLFSCIEPRVNAFPTTIFFNADGIEEERITGLHPYEHLEARVLKLLDKTAKSNTGGQKS